MKYHYVLAAGPLVAGLVAGDGLPPGTHHDPSWGNAIVENKCSQPAYYIFDNQPTKGTIAPGGTMRVPLYTKVADGGGGSIKLFTDPNTDIYAAHHPALTQFEFTPTTTNQFCDISNVNSNIGNGFNGNGERCDTMPPFVQGGMRLSFPGSNIVCCPGQNPCKTAYSAFDDDFATTASKVGDDITLTLCPNVNHNECPNAGASNPGQGSTPQQPQQPAQPQQPQQPAASPSPSPVVKAQQHYAQVSPKPDAQPSSPPEDVVWVTAVEYAQPEVVMVYKDSNGNDIPAPHKQKRQEHVHQHAHGKFNKRRHVA